MEKKQFEFYFSVFLISFVIGIIVIFAFTEPKKILVKYPNPINSEKTVYTNENGECYKVKAEEIECNGNERENMYVKEKI